MTAQSKRDEANAQQTEELKPPDAWFGIRHVQVILLFVVLFVGYATRIILSVAIVAMTDNTTSSNPDVPTYNWEDKSIVLSSYHWGYVILQVIGGPIGKHFNLRRILISFMVINSVACMLIPLGAEHFGDWGVMFLRFIQGLFSGILYPFVHTLLGRWAPPPERSRFGTFVYSGTTMGTILSMVGTGMVSSSWIGWPVSFYIFGSMGLVWAVFYIFFGASSPAEHSTISAEERKYIEKSLGQEEERDIPIPYKAIVTSLPFWAILVANCGQDWGFNTLLTEIPNYLNHVMDFDMKSNSLLSAAPYLVFWILCFVFGVISDLLINNRIYSRATVRKIFNTIGLCIPAAALIGLGYVPSDLPGLSVFVLIVTVGMNAGVYAGYQVNHMDLSPNHSGTMMGLTNGPGNIFSLLGPLSVQAVVTEESNKSQWAIVFIISGVIYVVSAIFYIFYAEADVQYWNDLERHEEGEEARRKKELSDIA